MTNGDIKIKGTLDRDDFHNGEIVYWRYYGHCSLVVAVASGAVELFDGYALHRDEVSLKCIEEFARKFILQASFDEYLVNVLTCLDGLNDGAGAEDEFVLFYHIVNAV